MPAQFVVGDTGTWITPEGTMDTDLSDDRWFPFTPTATYTDTTQGPPTPSEQPPAVSGDQPDVSDKPPPGTNMDEWAAQILSEAWIKIFGSAPNPIELQAVQAVARGESSYGWPSETKFPSWQGHHNWGACHCMMRVDGKLKYCMQDGVCVKGFMGTDRFNGVKTPTCFASFPTNADGATFFLTTLLVRRPNVKAVIGTGNAYRIALEMRKTSYFMFMDTRKMNSSDALRQMESEAVTYGKMIMSNATRVAKSRNTKLLLTMSVPGDIKPATTDGKSWPRDVTNVGDYSLVSSDTTFGPISGVLFGIGLGVLGIWGYKKWAHR